LLATYLLLLLTAPGALMAPNFDRDVAALADRDVCNDALWAVSFATLPAPPETGQARTEDGRLILTSGEKRGPVGVAVLTVRAPRDLPIADYPYLTVRMKGNGIGWYYVRPEGRTAGGEPCALWHEAAATDDRQGDRWETATFNLRKLAEECGTGAAALTGIGFACASSTDEPSVMEVDFACVHRGLVPSAPLAQESDFTNSLDDDGDGLTDGDDEACSDVSAPKWVLAYYHPWFGTLSGPHGQWAGWTAMPIMMSDMDTPSRPDPGATLISPEDIVPGTLGKRRIAAPYYPLDYARFPDYVPAEPLDYGALGGVGRYDCLDVEFVADQIRCAKRFGIDGFIIDVGGIGVFEGQVEAALEAARRVGGFTISVVYDWYYRNISYGLDKPKTPEAMARDLYFWRRRFGDHPNYLKRDGKPVIFASFLSGSGVSLDHWQRAVALSATPESLPCDGVLEGAAGHTVDLTLRFDRGITRPPGENRPLLLAFNSVKCVGRDYSVLSELDIGAAEARPALVGGWSMDEGAPGSSFVWAASDSNRSRLRLKVPEGTAFILFDGPGFTNDAISYTVEWRGRVCGVGRKGESTGSHSACFATAPRAGTPDLDPNARDYVLLLDSKGLAREFDGYASYGEMAAGRSCEVSWPVALVGGTALPGYNDTVIRHPGNVVDREGGMRFRRSFERALGARPDFLQICTWSEWGEGTVIEPTVEFGYQYCEIALTYSLIYHGLLRLGEVPSEVGLTVRRYDPSGRDGVRVSCDRPVTVGFPALRGAFRVTMPDGHAERIRGGAGGVMLSLLPGETILRPN